MHIILELAKKQKDDAVGLQRTTHFKITFKSSLGQPNNNLPSLRGKGKLTLK